MKEMAKEIPTKLKELLKEIGLTERQATWDCHGTPVVLHKALEKIAAAKGIVFEPPTIIESSAEKKIAVICVTGHMGEATEWSIGEAAPYNNKNGYPYAMAEKRAKDRVILKLAGLHGDVYSQDEAEDFNFAQFEAQITGQLGKDYFEWKRRISKFKVRGDYENREEWEHRANEFLTEWRDSLKDFAKKATADETFPTILIEKLRELYAEKKVELGL